VGRGKIWKARHELFSERRDLGAGALGENRREKDLESAPQRATGLLTSRLAGHERPAEKGTRLEGSGDRSYRTRKELGDLGRG